MDRPTVPVTTRTGEPPGEPAQAAVRDAVRLHAAGRLEAAVAAYRRILKRHPRDCACWANLGMALRQFGRRDEGLAVLRRGARVCPAFPNLDHNLGNALVDAGDLEGGPGTLPRGPRA